MFTCPGGVVVGAGVAAVGSAGAAVYGLTTAWSREDIDAARAVMDRSRRQTNLANALRDRISRTLHDTNTVTTVTSEPVHGGTPPIVLAIDIDRFIIREVGETLPDLWLEFEVAGGLYEYPDTRAAYQRRWRLDTRLGDYHELVD